MTLMLTIFIPFQRILHLSTKGTSTSEFKVAVEESLMYRINPSLNQVTKATIECSLYVPPGKRLLLLITSSGMTCSILQRS